MTEASAEFVALAREFCNWCEGAKSSDAEVLRQEAIRFLARLYAGVLALPVVERNDFPGGPEISEEAWQLVYRSFGALPLNYYHSAVNPSIEAEAVMGTGDAADDLADTYREIKTGVLLMENGLLDDGIWHWRWTFRVHWGEHALDALRALHVHTTFGSGRGAL